MRAMAPSLRQFARRTQSFEPVNAEAIAALEPELAGRFAHGLYFAPRVTWTRARRSPQLAARLEQLNVPLRFATAATRQASRRPQRDRLPRAGRA